MEVEREKNDEMDTEHKRASWDSENRYLGGTSAGTCGIGQYCPASAGALKH